MDLTSLKKIISSSRDLGKSVKQKIYSDTDKEEIYKVLFRESMNALVLTDEMDNITDVNDSFLSLTGFSLNEVMNSKVSELFNLSDKFKLYNDTNKKGLDESQEVIFHEKTGAYRIFKVRRIRLSFGIFQYMISDISDLKRTEKAFIESEAKWKFALDGAGLGVWDYDIRSGHVFYTNQWRAMIGFETDEIGDTIEEWFGRIHPDDLDKCQADFNKLMKLQSSLFQSEHRIKTKHGYYRWMFCRGKVMEKSEGGEPLRIIGTHFDISSRKSAEETIRESEVRLRTIFNSSSDAMLIIEDLIITDCNQSAPLLFGCSREVLLGQSLIEFLSSEVTGRNDDSNIHKVVSAALEGRKQFFEHKFRKNNGTLFDAEVYLNRFEIKGNYCIHVIIRDITEKKRNREILTSSELRFRTIFNTSQYSISINDLEEGKYVSVNPAFELLSGYNELEVVGKNSYELGLVKNPDDHDFLASELRKKGKIDNYKSVFYDRKGEMRNVLISSALILFENRECVLSTIVDITNMERAEQHLRQAQKMDVVGQLAGGVAHDFNNMLSGILGFAELLKLKIKEDDASSKYIDKIIETANRSSELTRKLLAFARKGKTVSTPIDIHNSIKEAVAILERSIDKRIKIEVNLDADQSTIIGDPSLLQNAFLNLGINARDAMPDGGTLAYSTSVVKLDEDFCRENLIAAESGSFIEVIVSDTGIGMNKDVMEKIFEPFFTTKEVGKGTGLGLAAVYGTIKEHRGIIKVFSELNVGTIFKIYIPLEKSAVQKQESETPEIITGNGKILFVDDESIIRNVGFSQLTNLGYEVILAEDGMQALEIFKQQYREISAVILDMIMPRLNGKDTFLKMREINPNVKVIFSSGFSHDGRVNDLLKMGAIAFLQKPYRIYDLSKILADTIKS